MTKDLFDKGDDNSVRLLTLDLAALGAVSPSFAQENGDGEQMKGKKEITESLEAKSCEITKGNVSSFVFTPAFHSLLTQTSMNSVNLLPGVSHKVLR